MLTRILLRVIACAGALAAQILLPSLGVPRSASEQVVPIQASIGGDRVAPGPGARPAILLVHGYPTRSILSDDSTGNDTCWPEAERWVRGKKIEFAELPLWLNEDGYTDILIAHYQSGPAGTPDIEVNADCLRQQVIQAARASATSDIIVITYSLGGLITRAYLESDRYAEDVRAAGRGLVRSAFLIAAPNHAMPFYNPLKLRYDCEKPDSVQRAACQFTSTRYMAEFNARHAQRAPGVDYYLIGGTHYSGAVGVAMGSYICAVMGPNDGTVPVASAIGLPGARQTAVFNAAHQSMLGESYVTPAEGEQQTETYRNCLYPVLVEGNPDGCTGNAPPRCETSTFAVGGGGIVLAGLAAALGLHRLQANARRRRHTL
jgi:hypothetical protein